jgi:hypothetical protein
MPTERAAQTATPAPTEDERSAGACEIAAVLLHELGEKLGPANDHGPWFCEWASRLQSQSRLLRGGETGTAASDRPVLSLVR